MFFPLFKDAKNSLGLFSLDSTQREFDIALRYIKLYAPAEVAVSLALKIHQIYDSTSTLFQISQSQKWQEHTWDIARCTATLFRLGVNYASPLGGALLSSGIKLGKQVYLLRDHASKYEWSEFNKELLETTITVIEVFAKFSGSPMLIALSLTFESFTELNESYSYYQEGKWPQALATLVLSIERLSCARPYASEAWGQYFRKSLREPDADRIFRRLSVLQGNLAQSATAQGDSLSSTYISANKL